MKERILVVDDDRKSLELLADFLERLGIAHDLADNLERAMELLLRFSYDVVLTDKKMPDSTGSHQGGMELLRHVRTHLPTTEVIMVTGYADIESAVAAMKLGAFDYLVKPVPLDALQTKLDRAREYRRFLSTSDTLRNYRLLQRQVLHHLVNRDRLTDDQLEEILRSLGMRMDHLFGLQNEYEDIIRNQTASLETIETHVRALLDAIPDGNPLLAELSAILALSQKRV